MSQTPAPFEVPDHVLSRKLEDETVLLNLDSGEYFGLNDTGTRVWELLVAGHGRSEIVDHLTAEFEVDRERARSHVAALCEELVAAGLLAAGGES